MQNHNISEDVESKNIIKNLEQRLNEALRSLSQFKVDLSVEIESSTFDLKITALKPYGGGGFIKTVPHKIALYYADDVSTLVEEVLEEVFEVLLKPVLKQNFMPVLSRALTNVSIKGKTK